MSSNIEPLLPGTACEDRVFILTDDFRRLPLSGAAATGTDATLFDGAGK